MELLPIKTSESTRVFKSFFLFVSILRFLNLSFIKQTPCPTKQFSPIFTFEQINVWLWILVFFPIFTLSCISTKGPIKQLSSISHPYRFTGSIIVTFFPNFTFLIEVFFFFKFHIE